MTYQPTTIAVRLAASVCLLLSGVTGVSAQLQCGMANSAGPPIVHDADIFCGVINAPGNAGGFHSRPNGINPIHIPAGGGVPVQVIGNGTAGLAAPGAPAGIYRLLNFTITQNGVTSVKAFSTMFPDHCSQASVLAAIRHAAAGTAVFGQFVGPSGPACTAGTGVQFDIKGSPTPTVT